MTFSLVQLQKEQAIWATNNFGPDRNPSHALLGIVEELGELVEALDGFLISSKPWFGAKCDIIDSLADIVIFSADYCTGKDWDMGYLSAQSLDIGTPRPSLLPLAENVNSHLRNLTKAVGRLCHHQLKFSQNIRGTSAQHVEGGKIQMERVFVQVHRISFALHLNFLNIIESVWSEVKKRNWKKDRQNGAQK